MTSYQRGNYGARPNTMSMYAHPHEQRAMAPRTLDFGDKKRPKKKTSMMPMPNGGSRPPNDRWGLDPDDLCRRLYSVIAEREGRSVPIRAAGGMTREERFGLQRKESREYDAAILQQHAQWLEPKSLSQTVQPQRRDSGSNGAGEMLQHDVQRIQGEARVKAESVNYHRRQAREAALPTVKEYTTRTPGSGNNARRGSRTPPLVAPAIAESQPAFEPQMRPSEICLAKPIADQTNLSQSPQEVQNYRHVPQVAAAQFERTTTVDPVDDRGPIHKLSHQAMSFHLAGLEQDASRRHDSASPADWINSLERTRSHRDREYERNQFQHPPIFEERSAHDEGQFRLPERQTFGTHFGKCKDGETNGSTQRFSVGSNGRPRESVEAAGFSIHQERAGDSLNEEAPQMKWRVDWTQSDEARPLSGNSNQAKLRKSESKWKLKGRLPSFQKSKENKTPPVDEEQQNVQLPKSPKSPSKSGFFGRFKR